MRHFPKRWEVTLTYLKYENGKLKEDSTPETVSFDQGQIPMLGENPALSINDIGAPTIKLMEPNLNDVFIDDIVNVKKMGRISGLRDLENKIILFLRTENISRRYDLSRNITILQGSKTLKING
jgi:hypothetical protein